MNFVFFIWGRFYNKKMNKKKEEEGVKEVKILTYNVWFDSFNREKRYQEILRLVEESHADVVCLQEVIPAFIQLFKQSKLLQYRYTSHEQPSESYRVMMLVHNRKYLNYRMEFLPFKNSVMDRGLLSLHLPNLTISTAHFESIG